MNNKNKKVSIPIDQCCESFWGRSLPTAMDLAISHHAKCSVMVVRESEKSKI
ncbi:hypothetical protein [Endozoicomonas sp. 8E]|uniref:hypothetical protein n=1 Tax=Endozoicomonas sp. 8E TaxID=3035692 RepID=UPI002938F659|nr:hypothetical protein [Endozoicomonas sp. 8E]WOG25503.1 hypothetical protein P6910_13015 [Endozoicomonas sp. 8E]